MDNTPSSKDIEYEAFLASYFIAHRIFGYLFANRLIKEPKSVEAEAAYLCEIAGLIRQTGKETKIKEGIYAYKMQFGVNGITDALELDIKVRGSEWEMLPLANKALEMMRSFEEL